MSIIAFLSPWLKPCFSWGLSNIGELLISGLFNGTQRHTVVITPRRLDVNWTFLCYSADKVKDEKDSSNDPSHHTQNDDYHHWWRKNMFNWWPHSLNRWWGRGISGQNRHFSRGHVMRCDLNTWCCHCFWMLIWVAYSWSQYRRGCMKRFQSWQWCWMLFLVLLSWSA